VIRESIEELVGSRVVSLHKLQSLWAGYGELVRAHLADGSSVIAKSVKAPQHVKSDASHARKVRSYDAELAFYESFASRCDEHCRVAKLLGKKRGNGEWLLLLEDLDEAGFAARQHDPRGASLDACLGWLAAFHARFVGEAPAGLWKTGTYWHLETRRDELATIADETLRARAPELDRRLRAARFSTIVHGDAKPDNFCFSRDGLRCAAVDFQYVGGGCGVSDVAYLLHGSSPTVEARGLDSYFARLRAALSDAIDGDALEREWRELYPVAHDDFRRFLAGWRR
jgi:hypothetical protein